MSDDQTTNPDPAPAPAAPAATGSVHGAQGSHGTSDYAKGLDAIDHDIDALVVANGGSVYYADAPVAVPANGGTGGTQPVT